jgi:hypothetical protein
MLGTALLRKAEENVPEIVGFLGLVSQETNDEARRTISNTRDARAALEHAAFEALIVNDAATDSVLSSSARLRLYVEPS